MTHINLHRSCSRTQLREFHEAMDAADPDSPVTLRLGDGLHARTPGQFSAWMQVVLTWGQNFRNRALILNEAAARRIAVGDSVSDIEITAVLLASSIRDDSATDVAAQLRPVVRRLLAGRSILTRHNGDGTEETQSLILAGHTFTNRVSPELHARWNSEQAIEETARTLYHDVWPNPDPPSALRAAMLEFGESAVPEEEPTHITRSVFPDNHPGATSEARFANLGRRTPSARGLALEMATKVRQREKPMSDELGEILFELVQNTEWHAAAYAGGRTGANCRVLHIREFSYSRKEMAEAFEFDPDFISYARAAANAGLAKSETPVERVIFGAVTIIDSGVGLARSAALSLDEEHLLTPKTEVGYLIKALNKSLKVRRADMGNIGLTRVQQSLTNLNGFMTIRTGTVEIRRDFVSSPFAKVPELAGEIPPSLFLDWVSPHPDNFSVGPRIGTAVTVVYPVGFERRQP